MSFEQAFDKCGYSLENDEHELVIIFYFCNSIRKF